MTFYISNAAAQAMANALDDAVNGGTGAAILRIYAGSVPADADAALGSPTLLGTIVLNDPAFGAAADAAPGATITLDVDPAVEDASADATGTAAFWRIWSTNDGATPLNCIMQGTCGTSPGGGVLVMATLSVVAGVAIPITSLTVTMPESA
ncbi:MAG: hypothetical protein GC206_13440 [Alphaproteobacteria bacterium]|nr:hypothetical protein [Alphaproteobacteria bacterium]